MGQYPNHALRTCRLACSITGTSALMGTRPRLESFYLIFVRLSIIIDHDILVRKRSDYDIPNHILWWITDFHVDNITISEVADKGQESCIHQVVDDLAWQARDDGFQLNERKCKELRISFTRNEPEFELC